VLVGVGLAVGFWVYGDILWRGWLVDFIGWWRGVLRMWDLDMWQMWWRWIGVVFVVWLFEWRLLPMLLLAKDLDIVLELCEPCPLSVYMLPSGFVTLSCGLPMSDGFLFLTEPCNILLNPG
jgi:hypothetical protein